jgi:hypothetical protein
MKSAIVIEKVTASTKRSSRGTHQMYRVESEDFLKTPIPCAYACAGLFRASGSSYFREALAATASIVPGTLAALLMRPARSTGAVECPSP